jgi:hypothetical protein
LVLGFFKIFGSEEHLSAAGFGIEHGDANDARGERIKAELLFQFALAGVPGYWIGNPARFAEEIFLLNLIEVLDRKRRRFDIED